MAIYKGKIKYTADSLRGGLVSDFGGISPTSSAVSEEGKYTQDQGNLRGVDITNTSFYLRNSIMPSTNSSLYKDMGSNLGQIYDGTPTSNTNIFFLTHLGNVIKLSASVYTDLGVVIPSSSADGSIWTHIDTAGNEKVFVAGNTGGNFVIKKMDPDGSNITTVSTNASVSTAKHRGVAGIANRSYITNGNYIAVYDPVAGTVNATKLNLGVGWVTTSIRVYGSYMAITGYKANGSSRLWLWDGTSDNPNFQYEINDFYATCYVEGDKLFIFSNGKNGTNKLYLFNNSDISGEPLYQTIGYYTNQNFVPEQGSVCSFRDGVYWRGDQGRIFAFVKHKGVWGVHNPYTRTIFNLADTIPGICKSLYSNTLFVPGSDTSVGISNTTVSGYSVTPSTYNTDTSWIGFPSEVLPYNSTINYVRFIFNEFKSQGGNEASVNFNIRNTDANDEYMTDGSTRLRWQDVSSLVSPVPNNYTCHTFNVNIPKINIFRLAVYLQSCAIREIEVGYSYDA